MPKDQRSAQAAKEIKGHIEKSSVEVESGVKLVLDTSQALKAISEQIGRFNQHMDAIATSAKEQSTGLAEVNAAVNSMDHGDTAKRGDGGRIERSIHQSRAGSFQAS